MPRNTVPSGTSGFAPGNDEYIEVTGDFPYVDDPYVTAEIDREPVRTATEVLIIGGGFGGMLAAARLKQAGITDIMLVEKGAGFGGTWY